MKIADKSEEVKQMQVEDQEMIENRVQIIGEKLSKEVVVQEGVIKEDRDHNRDKKRYYF